jgi:hypothetical protein
MNSNKDVRNTGGQKKGMTKKAIKQKAKLKDDLVMKYTISYQEKIDKAKKAGLANVPHGTLKKIVKEEEEKAELSVNTILLDTVRIRVKRGNLSAYYKIQQSPIIDIEPLICEFCISLRKMA